MACYVVAEVGQAHDGSLGTAHAYIDAAARGGAAAVKFQTHIATAESTPAEAWRVKFSTQDTTRFDYWRRMEFTENQWVGLREHAEEAGLDFLSSPFSTAAVDLLDRVGVSAWKIASGEVANVPLIERILADGRPIILSSGMSSVEELDRTVELIVSRGVELTVLQCTSAYPCPPEKLGLNLLPQLRQRYGLPIGLSDHSGTIFAGLAAATIGIDMLEIHVTLSREAFGPDVSSSITIDELAQLVQGIHFIEAAMSNPVDKDVLATELEPLRLLFTKSVVASEDLPPGTTLTADHLTLKKPGGGFHPGDLPALFGRKLARAVAADEQLTEDHLVPAS